jgi:hypothetical protein
VLSFSILFLFAPSASAANFTVNSTGNGTDNNTSDNACNDGTGNCTLRAAIMQANATPGTDTISFNIPGSGVQTISPPSALPAITDPLVIDGYTQPGSSPNTQADGDNAVLLIELDGRNARSSDGIWANGLSISAGSSVVRGLVLNGFGSAIRLGTNGGNLIEGNFIGTNASGTVKLPNNEGVYVGFANGTLNDNVIGGTTPSARNVISGNGEGIYVYTNGPGAGAVRTVVQGNFIGSNAGGTAALGNNGNGIYLLTGNNLIGGTTNGARNVISGNNECGVYVLAQGSSSATSIVQGNYIGTDVTGTLPLGNGNGILTNFASYVTIGGTTEAARNVISGNQSTGVLVLGTDIYNFQVTGNFIGVDKTGAVPLGNGLDGLRIEARGLNTRIGGTSQGAGNTIAYNGGNGVSVSYPSNGNNIRRNSIFSNAKLGIDLAEGGIYPNDPGDDDTGGNDFQNYPTILSVISNDTQTTIQGTLNSLASKSFTLEFFVNNGCDPSGHGEGASYIGTTFVTTNANGDATFSVTLPVIIAAGQAVTATATNPTSSTSGFSACYEVGAPGTVQFTRSPYIWNEAYPSATITVTRTHGTAGAATVDYTTSNGTATAGADYGAVSGTLFFDVGEDDKTITIPLINDQLNEATETVNLTLSNPTGGIVLGSQSTSVLNIIDDDDQRPAIFINDVSINEESVGQASAVFTVRLSAVSGQQVSVNYSTVDGTAIGGSDYTPVTGTVVFAPGQTTRNIFVPIIGDMLDEQNETFSLFLTNGVNGNINDNQGIATILDNDPDSGTTGEILISEFRTSGPAGANDEFIELYNNTDAAIDLRNYSLIFTNGVGSTSNVSFATVQGASAMFQPRRHLILANQDGYSLGASASLNFAVTGADFFPDNHGIALRRNGSGAQVDAVGFTSDEAGFREGAGLPVVSPFPAPALEYSYIRKLTTDAPQDTNDNATDFALVSTTGEMMGGVQSILGAPAPENFASPILHNDVAVSLIDPASPRLSSPNFVRTGSGNAGTLSIRRRFTNNTGATLTRIRFRVTDITTLGSPLVLAPPQADLRLANSADESITTSLGIPITLKGTTIEQPPAQNIGGGLNSSLSVQLPNGGLANGQSIDVQFLLNVVQNGRYRFFFNVEALP